MSSDDSDDGADRSDDGADRSDDGADRSDDGADQGDVLLELPESSRHAFKEPMGHVTTDAEGLAADAGDPLLAVGDVVTFHLLEAGRRPHLAVVDERTERTAVDDRVAAVIPEADIVVSNPAAALTRELLEALVDAVRGERSVVLRVEGEEDLATLPVVLAAPDGASVVYGQPGEGMVHVEVDEETRAQVRELFDLLEGDREAALEILGVE